MGTAQLNVAREVAVLSAMVTPTVLILAAASLIGNTANRLVFMIQHNGDLADHVMERAQSETVSELCDELTVLHRIVDMSATRIRLMQDSLIFLHIAIALFVLMQLAIGFSAVTSVDLGYAPIIVGLLGATLLLAVVLMLIYDARIGMKNARAETGLVMHRIDRQLGRVGGERWWKR